MMNVEEVYRWMKEPALLTEETAEELRGLIELYPLFVTAKVLYLINLSRIHHPSFADELQRLAVSLPDRKRLYGLIHGEWTEEGSSLLLEEQADTFSLIDQFLSSSAVAEPPSAESKLLFQPSASIDYLATMDKKKPTEAPVPPQEESEEVRLQHQDLIDSFLHQEEQKTVAKSPLETQVHAEESVPPTPQVVEENSLKTLDDSFFTETLAHIYIKQRRYERALQIIQNLRLKYPEKNIYFADQIRFLERLIINTKK
ncbi:MAG: hypothetical protein ACI30I_06945 [Parabacteroides sp.]